MEGKPPQRGGGPRWWAPETEPTGAWKERRRLADGMRRVIQRLVEIDPPAAELAAAADALERYADRLDAHPTVLRFEGVREGSNAGDAHAFFDQSPLIGRSNALAPPISLEILEGGVRAHVRFGKAYEGPPGHVHGGLIAAAFDEVLGVTQSQSGNPGFTGTLTVRYRKPTPLEADLRFEARIDRIEGRKIFTSGELFCADVLCAEAEGLFISVGTERFARMRAERERAGQDS